MSEPSITEQRLIVQVPETAGVSVRRDVPFGNGRSGKLAFDVYRPAPGTPGPLPAVILVTGYPETQAKDASGPNFKDWAAYIDWARLLASAGMIAITYRNEDPVRDLRTLITHVRAEAESLDIDTGRIGLWSCSGNAATALAALRDDGNLACAALCYGYLIDAPGADEVARAAAQFGFVHATAGMRIGDLGDAAILVVRAGRDRMPGLNASLDRFVCDALAANLTIGTVNFPKGEHAFDISDRSAAARRVVHQIVRFLALQLGSTVAYLDREN